MEFFLQIVRQFPPTVPDRGESARTNTTVSYVNINMEILDLAPIYKSSQSQRNPYTHTIGDTESERLPEYTGMASYKIFIVGQIGAARVLCGVQSMYSGGVVIVCS